jgi:N-acetylmuramoyl-L-alanine amidase
MVIRFGKALRVLFFALLFCFYADWQAPANASENPEKASLRVGRHASFVRLVFSVSEGYVQKSSVVISGNNIKVDFHAPAIVEIAQKGAVKGEQPVEIAKGVKVSVKGNSYTFAIEGLDDMEVSKLSSPSRLVIDARISKTQQPDTSEKTAVESLEIAMESFMLDAGHGGNDAGIKGAGFIEKDIALSIVKDISAALTKKGKKVFFTRKGDTELSLAGRIKAVNQKSPELLISVHVSNDNELIAYSFSGKSKSPKRDNMIEMGGQLDKNGQEDIAGGIANVIAQHVHNDLGISARHERIPVSLITHVNGPAVLIELPNPEKFNYNKKTREKLINAVLKGIASGGRTGNR